MDKYSKTSIYFIFAILLVFSIFFIHSVSPEVVDDGIDYYYGYEEGVFTNNDGLQYTTNNNGIVTIIKQDEIVGHFGFALTGTVNSNNYIYTSEDFSWSWSMNNIGDNYTFTAYNNQGNFNWTQDYYFYPNAPMKIVHSLTNNLGVPISNAKMWYIHTLENETTVSYNRTNYTLTYDTAIHLQGNFNEVIPEVEIHDIYTFNYSDLIQSNFDITDIWIGNGSLVNHPNELIIGVGVTKGDSILPDGFTIVLDPTIETVESTGDVGDRSSIAIDSNDIAHISHYDRTNDELRYCNNTGNSWSCAVADAVLNADVGDWSSIAIDSNDVVHISHYDDTNNSLRYCNNTGTSWSCVEIEKEAGEYSSIAIDSNDIVHISHHNSTLLGLRYCNNTGTSWSCVGINDTEDGYFTSIAIDSNDIVHISYWDGIGDDITYCNNTGTSWSCVDVWESVGASTTSVYQTSIAIDSNDVVHISGYDFSSGNEDLVYCNNTGTSWSCVDVDSVGDVGEDSSIAIDSSDTVHISYLDKTNEDIKYCNNIGNTWSCETIDENISFSLHAYGRALAVKKGRLVDSVSDSEYAHLSYQESSSDDLIYTRFNILGTLNTPLNNSWNTTLTIDFNCSFFSVFNLTNTTFYIWNSTGIVNNTENQSISGSINSSNFTIILPTDNSYDWNCYTCDENHNCVFADSNFTLNIDTINPNISIITPLNATNYSINTTDINYTVADTNLETCWYSNDTYDTNTTIVCGTNITTVVWDEGNHNVTVWANDSAGNENSSVVTFHTDTIPPSVTIDEPQASVNYADNNTIDLNYTVSDATLSVDTCIYNVQYADIIGYLILNTTIANCLNTTFALQGGDYDYNVHFFVNDSLNNVNYTIRRFGIRTESPAINLNYPTNNSYFDNGTDIYFNYTATDTDGLDNCRLYSDWNGSWGINFTWVNPTNATMNWTTRNISIDGSYLWNVWCNDTLNNEDFAANNFTVTIDTINPNITINSITTTAGSQTISFNSTEQDTNLETCFYSIFDSTGAIDGLNENVSVTCGVGTSKPATVTAFATYNLTVYANDSAGNENSTTQSFTTTATVPPGGGGGGGPPETEIPVIGLQDIENGTKDYHDLERLILFATINNYCSEKITNELLAVQDFSEECFLKTTDLDVIEERLDEFEVITNSQDLLKFYWNYKNQQLFQGFTTQENVLRYNLFVSNLGLLVFLQITPSRVDTFVPVYKPEGGNATIPYVLTSNKPLESCEVISDTIGLTCEILNSTIRTSYVLDNTDFFTRVFSGTILLTTDADPDKIEQRRVPISYRVVNFGMMEVGTIAAVVVVLFVVVFIFVRKRIKVTYKKR